MRRGVNTAQLRVGEPKTRAFPLVSQKIDDDEKQGTEGRRWPMGSTVLRMLRSKAI
jgi:hypothetical protein